MRILLADDHELVREGLKYTLTGLSPDVTFLEASTASEVIDTTCEHTDIDLLLLDLVMPGSNGFQLLKRRRTVGTALFLATAVFVILGSSGKDNGRLSKFSFSGSILYVGF